MTVKNTPVPIECLDKPRSLLFTLTAAAEIKSAIGTNPLMWIGIDWSMRLLDPEFLPAILKALLAHEGKPPSVELIRSFITTSDQLQTVSEAVLRAIAHFQGKSDEDFDADLKKFYEEAEKARLSMEPPTEDPSKSPPIVN